MGIHVLRLVGVARHFQREGQVSVLTEPEAFAAEQQGSASVLYDSHEELRAELDAAKERIAKLVAVVRAIEWQTAAGMHWCMCCNRNRAGHTADCVLKSALEGE